MKWYVKVLKDWRIYNARASRTEYWVFSLFNTCAVFAFVAVGNLFDPTPEAKTILGTILMIFFLVLLAPGLAVSVRRLHDSNKTGWFLLVNLVPYIGGLIFLIFMLLDSTPGENKYGANPKEATSA